MFAHKVIESIERHRDIYSYPQNLILWIRSSPKFNIGNGYDIAKLFKYNKNRVFEGDFSKEINPPYGSMWVDGFLKFASGQLNIGFLIEESFDRRFFTFCLFTESNKSKEWVMAPLQWIFNYHAEDKSLGCRITEHIKPSVHSRAGFVIDDRIIKSYTHVVGILNFALMLLNSRNIGTQRIYSPENLNKKRKKAGKQPLFTYHTLVLKPVGKKQKSIPKHLWNNRIHFQRGHFKTYTQENPLFGRITGRFWWQPQVRGQNRDGIVMKDYLVKGG